MFTSKFLKNSISSNKFKIIPIKWTNRKKGYSKFKVNELGSMYMFTLLYCFLEQII